MTDFSQNLKHVTNSFTHWLKTFPPSLEAATRLRQTTYYVSGIPCIKHKSHVLLLQFIFPTFPFNVKAARTAVRIVTGPRTGRSALRIPARACEFPLLRKFQPASRLNPASYLIGTLLKRPRREFHHLPPYCAELTD